jgi:N-carbamoylputrescine amidase
VRARAPRDIETILVADIDLDEVPRSHARRVLMRDRRPELYGRWLGST